MRNILFLVLVSLLLFFSVNTNAKPSSRPFLTLQDQLEMALSNSANKKADEDKVKDETTEAVSQPAAQTKAADKTLAVDPNASNPVKVSPQKFMFQSLSFRKGDDMH